MELSYEVSYNIIGQSYNAKIEIQKRGRLGLYTLYRSIKAYEVVFKCIEIKKISGLYLKENVIQCMAVWLT